MLLKKRVIRLQYKISNDIQSKKELLDWCYPKVIVNQTIHISNKDSKLVKICSKNANILDLVKKLDLIEV